MSTEYLKRKIMLLGDGAVGKTSVVRRFVVDKFSDDYITTIGTKVTKKDLRFEMPYGPVNLTLMIWDILGQKGYTTIQESSFQGAKGVLLVCDLTRNETFDSLETYWIPRLTNVAGRIPQVIVGNKVDLVENRKAAEDKLGNLSKKHECPCFVSSAKTGENVEAAFLTLGKSILATREITVEGEAVSEGERAEEEPTTLIEAADRIITDFCEGFGGQETGMAIVKQQLTRANVDVKNPSAETLRQAVEYLAEVEKEFKSPEEVEENKRRRLEWIDAGD